MALYPLGISRRRDVPGVPKQAAGSIDMQWSLAGELACAFIDAPTHAVPPKLHAAALDAIHRRICVLPVRFGVALHDEAEIHALLQDRCHELLDLLGRLDRTCEMGLRIVQPTTDSQHCMISKTQVASFKPQSPVSYIEERRSYYQRTDENVERDGLIVRQFVEQLQGCYRQWRRLQSSASDPIRLAFLVEQDRVAAFLSCVKNACNTDQKGRCAILGPWPPYSFV